MIDCSSDDSGEDDTAETITEVEETSTSVGEGSDGPTDEGGTGNAGGNWNAPTGSKKGTSNTGSTDKTGTTGPDIDTPPVVAKKSVAISNVGERSFAVEWQAATDDRTPADKIEYGVIVAPAETMVDDFADALAFPPSGAVVVDWTASMTAVQIEGLTPDTTYAIHVGARDEGKTVALFDKVTATTAAASGPTTGTAIAFENISASGATGCTPYESDIPQAS